MHNPKKPKKKIKLSKGMQKNLQTVKRLVSAYWFPVAAALVIIFTVIACVSEAYTIYTANSEHEEVLEQIEEKKALQEKLLQECEQLQDRQHIEQIAREELGLVKEGEIPFISRYKKTN